MNNPTTPSHPYDAEAGKTKKDALKPNPQPLSEETVRSLIELGDVLKQIRTRLLSEGYTIKAGQILAPDSNDTKHGDR